VLLLPGGQENNTTKARYSEQAIRTCISWPHSLIHHLSAPAVGFQGYDASNTTGTDSDVTCPTRGIIATFIGITKLEYTDLDRLAPRNSDVPADD
jgi:hypothetical protein